MARRKTRWFANVQTGVINANGAAAPGTVVDTITLGEALIEDTFSGATIIRTVGDIWIRASAGVPVMTAVLWFAPTYLGSVNPTDWVEDTVERSSVMMSWMVLATTAEMAHIFVDVRSKRKLEPGVNLTLSVQNHSLAGDDARITWFLKHLILMP